MQQLVGQGVGEELQCLLRRRARGELLPGFRQCVSAGGFAMCAQLPERAATGTRCELFRKARRLQFDDGFSLFGGTRVVWTNPKSSRSCASSISCSLELSSLSITRSSGCCA